MAMNDGSVSGYEHMAAGGKRTRRAADDLRLAVPPACELRETIMAGRRRRRAWPVGVLAAIALVTLGSVASSGLASAQEVAPPRNATAAIVVEVVWLSVGETRSVDVSSAFVGVVDSFTAQGDNDAAVSVTIAGPVVSLTGVATGVAFVEVIATNAGGSASVWISAASGLTEVGEDSARDTGVAEEMLPIDDEMPPDADAAPDANGDASAAGGDAEQHSTDADGVQPLSIILVAPEWCPGTPPFGATTLEQFAAFRATRETVWRFDLSYAVVGGRAPYVVTSLDAYAPASSPSGVLRMACAVPDPDSADGERLYFAERWSWTYTVEVTDADGARASAAVYMKLSS